MEKELGGAPVVERSAGSAGCARAHLGVRVRVRAASDLPPPALRTIVPCGGAVGTPSLAEAPGPVVAVVVGPRP